MSEQETATARAIRFLRLAPDVRQYRSRRAATLLLVLGCATVFFGCLQVSAPDGHWFGPALVASGAGTALLALSDLVDTQTAIDVGKILAAGRVITGTVIEMSATVVVFGRIINVETAEVESVAQVILSKGEGLNSLL